MLLTVNIANSPSAQFVKNLSNLKPIHVTADGSASFELDMDLIEPSRSIFLYKVSPRLLPKFDKVGVNRCPSLVLLLFTTVLPLEATESIILCAHECHRNADWSPFL